MENHLMQITNYLLTQSRQIVVLVVVIAAVSLALKNKSAHIRYLLWLIVLAKCLVPPLLTIPLAILPQEQIQKPISTVPVETPAITAEAIDITATEPAVLSSVAVTEPTILERLAEITAQQWLGFAWVIGAIVFVLVAVIKALRVNRWLRKERKYLPEKLKTEIENFLADLDVKTFPKVWLIDGIGQPFVWGLLRGGIYLPANFAKTDSADNQRGVWGHELSHVLRFDAGVNLLQIIAQTIFWFHPFVWWANRKIRAEREKCCDETAVAGFGVKCKDYSTAIVNTLIAEHKSAQPIPSLAIAGPVKNIEDRIKTIMKPGKKFYKRAGLKAAITILMLALIAVPTTLALTARTGNKTEKIDYSSVTIEEGVGFDDIIVADSKCSREFVKSKLGKPDEDVKDTENGWWLNYGKKYGIDFWLNKNDTLREIRINKGFKGELTSGISMASTKQDVFKTYGEPVSEKTVSDLTKYFEDQVLYKKIMEERFFRKQEYSKIFYNQNGLLFWFKGDKINQIVIHPKEQKPDVPVGVKSNLEVLNVKFEPIQQGKNVVQMKVQNRSDKEEVFAVHIYTRSPDYGKNGVGWGTRFFDTIKPKETKLSRFVYKIPGPVTENTWLRLKFYNPESIETYDYEKYFEQKRFEASELERWHSPTRVRRASKQVYREIVNSFEQIQSFIKTGKYERAWDLFTGDHKKAEYQTRGFGAFKRQMEPKHKLDSAFTWERDDFLSLKPQKALRIKSDDIYTLVAVTDNQQWQIDFIKDSGLWKIDWIGGYTPRVIQNWEERLLPKMVKYSTEHFDIYYFKNLTAEKDVEKIAKDREAGYTQICEFLGIKSNVRIKLVFFEDEKTKLLETGHQGRGWTYGNTIVEVYNEQTQLGPFTSMSYILKGYLGEPPALFNYGFSLYISEQLGAKALKNLGGRSLSLYERARELKKKGQWIDLKELITYTDIGPAESQPRISYAEAGAFVRFLIDTFGRDKFLQAYRQLKNSDDKTVQQQNVKKLSQIYGKPLQELERQWLERQWEDAFLTSSSHKSAEQTKAEIQIEARFLLVPVDANEFTTFFEEEKIAFDANKAVHMDSLNAQQAEQLLKLVNANPAAKTLTAPKVRVFDGEETTLRTQETIKYEYTDPNAISEQPEQKELQIGTILQVKPTLQADNKEILLEVDFEHTNLLGFEDGLPQMEKTKIKTRILAPNGQTLFFGGQKISREDEQDGRIVQENLLVLIKAEKVEAKNTQAK